jgi:hypothetical protein
MIDTLQRRFAGGLVAALCLTPLSGALAQSTNELTQIAGSLLMENPMAPSVLQASSQCDSTITGYPSSGFITGNFQCANGGETGFHIYQLADTASPDSGEGQIDAMFGSGQQKASDGPAFLPGSGFGRQREEETFTFPIGKRGDRFVLGDHRGSIYATKNDPDDVDDDFAYIDFFEPEFSEIQLHGSPDDYVLAPVFTPEVGTAIFRQENTDLVGFIRDWLPRDLSELDGDNFVYAEAPVDQPVVPKLAAISHPGLALFREAVHVDETGSFYLSVTHSASQDESIPAGMVIARYDSGGDRLWLRRYGQQLAYSMRDADGFLYVCTTGQERGQTEEIGETNFSRVLKIDASDGEIVDQLDIDDLFGAASTFTTCAGAVADDAGHLYVTGEYAARAEGTPPALPYLLKLDRQTLNPVWMQDQIYGPDEYRRAQLHEAWGGVAYHPSGSPGEGQLFISGYRWRLNTPGEGPMEMYVASFDQHGNELWKFEHGGNGVEWPRSSAVDAAGNYYINGITTSEFGLATIESDGQGSGDGFIMKVSPDGEILWTRRVGTDDGDSVRKMRVGVDPETGEQVLYAVGHTFGEMDDEPVGRSGLMDLYVMKLALDGSVLGVRQFGTEQAEMATVASHDGFVYVAGLSYGSMVEDNDGGMDLFVTLVDGADLSFVE